MVALTCVLQNKIDWKNYQVYDKKDIELITDALMAACNIHRPCEIHFQEMSYKIQQRSYKADFLKAGLQWSGF